MKMFPFLDSSFLNFHDSECDLHGSPTCESLLSLNTEKLLVRLPKTLSPSLETILAEWVHRTDLIFIVGLLILYLFKCFIIAAFKPEMCSYTCTILSNVSIRSNLNVFNKLLYFMDCCTEN